MLNGMYVAAGSMLAQSRRVDTLANNLANINTNGYKKDKPVFTLFEPRDVRIPQNIIRASLYNKTINSTVRLDEIDTNFTEGPLKETGDKYDFALTSPKDFFTVDTPFGLRYTQDGAFSLDKDGFLVTQDGLKVVVSSMDGNSYGPLKVPMRDVEGNLNDFKVSSDGVVYINNTPTARLSINTFQDTDKLQKIGANLYSAINTPAMQSRGSILQGYTEGSNVNPVYEMVQMIDAHRDYEFNSKFVSTYDELNKIEANRIAG